MSCICSAYAFHRSFISFAYEMHMKIKYIIFIYMVGGIPKLDDTKKLRIYEEYCNTQLSANDMAKKYNISIRTVFNIKNRFDKNPNVKNSKNIFIPNVQNTKTSDSFEIKPKMGKKQLERHRWAQEISNSSNKNSDNILINTNNDNKNLEIKKKKCVPFPREKFNFDEFEIKD
jgi:hypothetical protein